MNNTSATRRVLKRSASIASLPTPPRTYRRRARGRSRGSCDSDSDSDNAGSPRSPLATDDEDGKTSVVDEEGTRKRRRISLAQDKDDEDAFWMGGNEAGPSKVAEPSKASSSSKPKPPLLYRKLQASISSTQLEQGPLSPPASHRKSGVAPAALAPGSPSPATTVSPPVTPRARETKALESDIPVDRLVDSPSNPFIATPIGVRGDSDSEPVASPAAEAEDEDPIYDKPTVTYVFRGVRRVYQNPMFNHAKNRPLSPPPNSKLPVNDPLFSPDPTCKPRLLFPEAHKKRKRALKKNVRAVPARSNNGESDSDPDNDTFGGRISAPKFAEGQLTLEAELRKAATTASDDDIFR